MATVHLSSSHSLSSLPPPEPIFNRRSSKSSAVSVSSNGSSRSSSASSFLSRRSSALSSSYGGCCSHCAEMGLKQGICSKCRSKGTKRRHRSLLDQSEQAQLRIRPLAELPPEANELMSRLRDESVEIQEVQEILRDCPVAVNAREETFGWSPLLFAAHRGDSKLLTLLLDSHADVRCACHHGNTALHLAARGSHANAVTLLHAKGSDCEAKNKHGWTALIWATIAGAQAVANVLIDNAADINAEDEVGRTPCMWAARHGHTDILRTLMSMGIDLSTCDHEGRALQDHAKAFEELRACLGLDGGSQRGWSRGKEGDAYWATEQGSLDLTKLMLQHGASTESSHKAWTSGCDLQNLSQPEYPLAVVAEAVSASQRLLAAARANCWEDAEAALRDGACAATRSYSDSLSALDWAALHNAAAAAMTLVVAKAQVEARDRLGWTAVHHAVHAGSAETTSVLHYLGADFTVRSDEGDTVQHLAARADAGALLQLLHPATPDWELRDSGGLTPLQAAASRGCVSSLRILLTLGADIHATDRHGRSAFALSVVQGHAAVVCAFLDPPQPLEQLWQEEELHTILQGLPWVGDEAVGSPTSSRRTSSIGSTSGASGVSSTSAGTSHRSNVSSAEGGRKRGRKRSIKMAMHTIAEVDSEDSASPSPRGIRSSSRDSQGSRCSDASNGTMKSAQTRTSAVSRRSAQSHVQSRTSDQGSKVSRGGMSSASSKAGSQGFIKSSASRASSQSKIGSSTSRRTGTGSKTSQKSSQGWVGTRISNSPVGLMWSANMASKKPELLPTPVAVSATLRATDNDGRAALALAAHFGQSELVSLLIRLKAPLDAKDTCGYTALMTAAVRGDRLSVGHLLEASASVDLRSFDGSRAVDLAGNAEVRRALQEHADRIVIKRQMNKSCSLPSLVKAPANSAAETKSKSNPKPILKFRLRLDCLPFGLPGEHVESEVWDLLDQHGVVKATDVEVAVDPITQRSHGHAYIEFANAQDAEAADSRLRSRLDSESFLRISVEASAAA